MTCRRVAATQQSGGDGWYHQWESLELEQGLKPRNVSSEMVDTYFQDVYTPLAAGAL